MEQARRGELRFDALVAQDRIAAAHIEHVVRADVMRVPGAEREAAAIVRALEERVPARHAVDQDVLGSVEQRFDLARDVRVQGLDFLGLRLLDSRLTRRWLRLLRDDDGGPTRQGDDEEQPRPAIVGTHRSQCPQCVPRPEGIGRARGS